LFLKHLPKVVEKLGSDRSLVDGVLRISSALALDGPPLIVEQGTVYCGGGGLIGTVLLSLSVAGIVPVSSHYGQVSWANVAALASNRAIFENAIDSSLTVDRAGRIIDFNPAAERIFDRRRNDVIGHVMVYGPGRETAAPYRGDARLDRTPRSHDL
jgi:PAS domain-containing protein